MADLLGFDDLAQAAGQDATDYLGRQAPVAFKGQPALPVGGSAPSTPAGPGGIAPSGGPGGFGSLTGGPGGAQDGSGGANGLARVLQALGLAGRGLRVATGSQGGTPADPEATQTGYQGFMPVAIGPEMLGPVEGELAALQSLLEGTGSPRPTWTPEDIAELDAILQRFSETGGPSMLGSGAASAAEAAESGAAAAAGETGASAGSLLGTAGSVLPYLAAAYNIAQAANRGDKPEWKQAADAASDVVGAAFAPATFGGSMLGSQLAKTHSDNVLRFANEGEWGAFALNMDPIIGGFLNSLTSIFGKDFIGELFAGGETFKVQPPGYTEAVETTRSGAGTIQESFNEGQYGAQRFVGDMNEARDTPSLVKALNDQYSAHPGQFRVQATTSLGEKVGNVSEGGFRPWTEADLTDPAVLESLAVYAGAKGAPAIQSGMTEALRSRFGAVEPPAPPIDFAAILQQQETPGPGEAPAAAMSPGGGGSPAALVDERIIGNA